MQLLNIYSGFSQINEKQYLLIYTFNGFHESHWGLSKTKVVRQIYSTELESVQLEELKEF